MVLSARRKTEIADEEVNRVLEDEKRIVDSLYAEGGFIGDIMLPGPARLDRYWAVTPDLSDVPLLIDSGWEARIRAGLDKGPVNPYWKNLLREPGLLESTSRDFVRLNQQYEGRYEVAPGAQQPQVAAGGGLPLPQAPAPGPAQPPAGSSPGSYGAP